MTWTVEYAHADCLRSLQRELSSSQFDYVAEQLMLRLRESGLNLLATNHVRSLSHSLFELRIRRDPELLVRIFFTLIHPSRLVVVGGYNKKRDSSELKQRREIKAARQIVDELNGRS
jgi:hypothetical protein